MVAERSSEFVMSVSVIGISDSSLDFSGATVVPTVADLTLVLADTSRIV